ncbi:class I adenylate-forming enzyme family protein [Streptomyces sp. Wh19]|uniref:class I adenylate-forming enzyme family protein n=1 Tax=Streptomyces sp. Wh19 TaxID=3076629 RepID=UPI0029589D79|nr:class I adenylate-forming enzyme family protein [Streptomyces sp. Wh19]MDV9194457.1 class I adenylate-forming enzyme family protein [Streptomyces sp. Wh19]
MAATAVTPGKVAHIPALVARQAGLHAERIAMSVNDREPLTYLAWWRCAQGVARSLRPRVRPGDLVALPFPADLWPEYCIAYVASQLAGAVPVPVRPDTSAREWRALFDDHAVGHVLTPDAAGRFASRTMAGAQILPLAELQNPVAVVADPSPAARVPDTAHVLPTSGTTGTPKPVAACHTELLDGGGFPPGWAGGTLVHVMAPASAAGTEGAMLLGLKSGMHVTTVAPVDCAPLMEKVHEPSTLVLLITPAVALRCLRGGFLSGSVKHVKLVMVMGAAAPPHVMQELSRFFASARVLSHYGATEAGTAQLLMPFDRNRPSAVGRAVGRTQVRIVADEQQLPPGEVGEVLLRREGAPPRHYVGWPELSRRVFRSDGWVRTGDLGFVDEDGYLHLRGRKKDIVMRAGLNIAPIEVEEVLTNCPDVDDAAAFGVPHTLWGEILVAAVVSKQGTDPTEGALLEALRAELALFKVPSRIMMVEALPRNAGGKVNRAALRETYAIRYKDAPDPAPEDQPFP